MTFLYIAGLSVKKVSILFLLLCTRHSIWMAVHIVKDRVLWTSSACDATRKLPRGGYIVGAASRTCWVEESSQKLYLYLLAFMLRFAFVVAFTFAATHECLRVKWPYASSHQSCSATGCGSVLSCFQK